MRKMEVPGIIKSKKELNEKPSTPIFRPWKRRASIKVYSTIKFDA
jgi:hypothetical protein